MIQSALINALSTNEPYFWSSSD